MTTLVVTDLDGTLWDSTLRCLPEVRDAVVELQSRPDVEFLVATGRRRNSARRCYQMNDLVAPSVLLNGAIGFDFLTEELFHQVTFDATDLARVLSVLDDFDLSPVAYLSDTRAFAVEGVSTSAGHLASLGEDLVWSSRDDLAPRSDVLGMSMLGVDADMVQPALAELTALMGVEVAAYADHLFPPYSLMLGPANVTKEIGILAYCSYRDLKPDRVVAVGDGGNDLQMLAMADLAVAVSGGDERALDLADHVIDRPERGGWAAVLDLV